MTKKTEKKLLEIAMKHNGEMKARGVLKLVTPIKMTSERFRSGFESNVGRSL